MIDVPFTAFAFSSADGTEPRTMPDRLAEVKNVLDFGADPTGNGGTAAATTAAIQAAVDAVSGADRGVIYFPLGQYATNSAITLNYNGPLNICFRGDLGAGITASGSDHYIIDRKNTNSGSPNYADQTNIVFEKLGFQNPDSSNLSGCVRLGSTNGAAFRDCGFLGQNGVTTEDSAGNSSQNVFFENCKFSGSNNSPYTANGVVIGGSGVIAGCDFVATGVGVRAYGKGLHVCGCRAENTNTAFLFGMDSADADQGASGFSLTSFSSEGNGTGVYLQGTCSGFLIGPGGQQGHDASNSGYPLGVQASQYGLRLGPNCSAGLIQNWSGGSVAEVAAISIADASARANVFFLNCSASQSGGGGVAWELPSNAYTAFFQYCNQQPVWTFSQLPTGGDVLEGDEFNISDGTNGLAWGDTATNTGTHTTHYLVRWNGSNYTVVGK
jgi:hypothetical protein